MRHEEIEATKEREAERLGVLPFGSTEECPKCGWKIVSPPVFKSLTHSFLCATPFFGPDVLAYDCVCCKHTWYMRPKDYKEPQGGE